MHCKTSGAAQLEGAHRQQLQNVMLSDCKNIHDEWVTYHHGVLQKSALFC